MLNQGNGRSIFNAGFEDIAELDCRGEYLVFRGGFSGIDNIYALNLKNCFIVSRVTSSKFGAFMPSLSANGDTMIYSDYTSPDFDIVKTAFRSVEFTPPGEVRDHQEQLNLPSSEEESNVPVPGAPDQRI